MDKQLWLDLGGLFLLLVAGAALVGGITGILGVGFLFFLGEGTKLRNELIVTFEIVPVVPRAGRGGSSPAAATVSERSTTTRFPSSLE